MPVAWRLLKTRHLAHAWDGEGARRYGGRWNSPGVPVVYSSETLALALLEVLAHLQDSETLAAYSAVRAEFDDSLVSVLPPKTLPDRWRDHPPPPEVTAIGDRWARSGASGILRVPSVIVPFEHGYLFNPEHPQFAMIRLGETIPFPIDSRLAK